MRKASESSPALWQFLNQKVDDLRGLVPRAQRTWKRDGVHHARVTTRRIQAVLDLLTPLLQEQPRRQLVKVLRKIRRGLGPVRDRDIMLAHLEELRKRGSCEGAIDWMSGRLAQERLNLQRKC